MLTLYSSGLRDVRDVKDEKINTAILFTHLTLMMLLVAGGKIKMTKSYFSLICNKLFQVIHMH